MRYAFLPHHVFEESRLISAGSMTASLSPNKQRALDFYNAILEYPMDVKKVCSFLADPFTSSHVVHPTFNGKPQDWAQMFANYFPNDRGMIKIEVQRMIEEGVQVWMWVLIDGIGPRKHSVDILTFKDGLISKHFDIQQDIPVPESAA